MNKLLTAFPLALAFAGLLCRPAAAQQAAAPAAAQAPDKEALAALVADYENAWNRHDAPGLAALYCPDATWVNWFGAYSRGRPAIQAHYAAVHGTYFKASHYYTRAIEDLTFVKPDVAIMHVRTGLSGDTRYPGQTFEFRRTLVLAKRDGSWGILAGQNAKLNEGVQ